MSFNEMNTIENALRDQLVGKPVMTYLGKPSQNKKAPMF